MPRTRKKTTREESKELNNREIFQTDSSAHGPFFSGGKRAGTKDPYGKAKSHF
jgi:hypothetical protein